MKSVKFILLLVAAVYFIGCGSDDNKNSIEASGNIESTNVVVSSQVTGDVLVIKKDEGEHVEAGDTIMIINHETLDYQLQQAEAAHEAAVAQYKLLKEGARSEDIKQAEDALNQAQVNLNLAESNYKRMKKLYDTQSITKQQYDDVTAKYELAKAQLNSAKANLKKVKNLARPEELKQADANVKRQEAAVKLLKKNIRDSYVTSPIDGFIVKKFVEQGETVTMLTSLFKVSNLNPVDLVIYVSEENLGKVQLGQKADVSTDTYKNKNYEGVVYYISPEAEFTPKNIQTKDERTKLVFAVKIRVKNPSFELKPGMPADAVVYLK